MINIQISDDFTSQVDAQKLEQAAVETLRREELSLDEDLSVVVEDDAHLHELNHRFLNIDAPTDVLSFPSGESEPDPESGRMYLGDVIISYPRALEQSAAAGHGVMDEMQLLVVHGVLHLLGYDHYDADQKAAMWAAQSEVLKALGVSLKRLPE